MMMPYTSHNTTLVVANKNITSEISCADFVFQVLITCGKKTSEDMVPATYPRISIGCMIVVLYLEGKNENVKVMIVPGSQQVAAQIVAEGLDVIFTEAGFKIRQAGCSACLGMNEDKIPAGEYCISTSNRNFEGRQGAGARTLLASPLTAAAAAITGVVTDVRELLN